MRFIASLFAYALYAVAAVAQVGVGSRQFLLSPTVSGGVSPVVSQNFLTTPTLPAWLDVSGITGNRMVYDSTGKLTYAPNNTLTYSNTFNNGVWSAITGGTGTNFSVTSGQTDPLSGSNAWRFQADRGASNTGSDYSLAQHSAVSSSPDRAMRSIWVKSNTGSSQTFIIYDSDHNLGKEFTATTSWAQVSLTETSPGVSSPVAASTVTFNIGLRGGNPASNWYSGGGQTLDILIYSASVAATTYETAARSGDDVIITSAAYYGPRFDYPNAVAAGLLIEESRTNVALWSRNLTNAAWTKTNVTAALNQTGVDTVANSASSITATAGNGTVLQAITLGSSQRFQTAFVKRISGTGTVNMTTDGGATWTAITVTGSWTRVSIPAQTVTNPSIGFQIVTNGDAIAVDYVQNETGPFATSPIPTTSASVTRVADIINLSGSALTTMQGAAGTVLQEINLEGNTAVNQYGIYGNTVSPIYLDSTPAFKATNGTNVLSSGVSAVVGTSIRAGLAWDGGPSRAISANGSAAVTDANSFGSIGATEYLGSNNGANVMNGWVRALSFYNSKLTGSTFTAKTTTGGAL